MKFQFLAGWRSVTVRALTLDDAVWKALAELDRRAEKQNRESPVGWSLVPANRNAKREWKKSTPLVFRYEEAKRAVQRRDDRGLL